MSLVFVSFVRVDATGERNCVHWNDCFITTHCFTTVAFFRLSNKPNSVVRPGLRMGAVTGERQGRRGGTALRCPSARQAGHSDVTRRHDVTPRTHGAAAADPSAVGRKQGCQKRGLLAASTLLVGINARRNGRVIDSVGLIQLNDMEESCTTPYFKF